jgi:hypothetical protein
VDTGLPRFLRGIAIRSADDGQLSCATSSLDLI